jgi:outer membrane immunogenic protein
MGAKMKKSAVLLSTFVSLAALAYAMPARADTDSEAMKRLEAKIDALAKENAALRERVKRVESSRTTTAAAPQAASGKPAAAPAAGSVPAGALAAHAAYMPVKGAPMGRPGCANFGGWNAGVNAGLAVQNTTWNDLDNWIDNFNFDFNSSSVSRQRTGGTVGGSLGYMWQTGCTVFGVEGDINYAFGLDKTTTASPAVGGTTLSLHDKASWWGTLRTRGGIAVDNVLLYLTGGFAAARLQHDWTIFDPGIPATESFSAHKTRWGGVVGAGAEWAVNDRWSIKSETLYIALAEDHTSGFSTAGGQTVNFRTQDSLWISRIGATYRWGATP